MKFKFDTRTLVLLLFLVLIIGLRIIAPLSPDFKLIANFSGLGAAALFGGAYFKQRFTGFALPMVTLLLSDVGLVLIMGKEYGFYSGWYYTYIAFALMIMVGRLLINKATVANVFGAGLVAVFIHWIVADIGFWLGSADYPQTLAGFWACLVAAIPFEKNFLYGTMGYSIIMFGLFESLKVKYPALSLKTA